MKKKEKVKKEKQPMTPEVKRTWMTCVTAFICVIAVSATANNVVGKLCEAEVESAKASTVSTAEQADDAFDEGGYTDNPIEDTISDGGEDIPAESGEQSADVSAPADNGGSSTSSSSSSSGVKTTAKNSSGKKSVAEIVNLYNTAANKIKPNAKSITRNYSKVKSLDKYLELPSAISSLGKWAINTFVKGSDEPLTFSTKEEITANFPVGGESYTSKLTADMVKSATCKDTGKAYDITIVLYNDKITSPKKGTGYAGVFNTVSASTFDEINVPGTTFETVKINGINGKIQCKIDKSTERVTDVIFTNTDVLHLGVKVAGSNLNVKFALSSENSYSIKY